MKNFPRGGMLAAGAILIFACLFSFSVPIQARADTAGCLAGILAGQTTGTTAIEAAEAQGYGYAAMSVPANDGAAKAMLRSLGLINSNTSGQTQGFTVQRCIVEPLVTTMARSLLDNFTAQTVKWINSGFKGNPLYVTNVQGFFGKVADEAAGSFIEGLGPIGQILCSPFDLQLRLSLNLQYGTPDYYQEVGCRLSDIQQNVQRAFTGGAFGKNGWDNWLQLNASPQNNPYGAYIEGVNAIDAKILGTQYGFQKELDWGAGFLSSEKCIEWSEGADEGSGESNGPKKCLKTKIETPGSVIEDQLNKSLSQPLQNVGLAKDIDAILNALVGQMINQVLGPGGLLGASDSGSGGPSKVDQGLQKTVTQIIKANTESQNNSSIVVPAGTKDVQAYLQNFCKAFKNDLYFKDTAVSPEEIKYQKYMGNSTTGKPLYETDAAGQPVYTTAYKGSVKWTIADYEATVNYCDNIDITGTVKSGTDEFNDATKTDSDDTPAAAFTDTSREIRIGTAILNQSSIYHGDHGVLYGPERALSGSTYSATAKSGEHWWSASLRQSEKVERFSVRLYPGYETGVRIILADLPSDKQGIPIKPTDLSARGAIKRAEVEFEKHTLRLPVDASVTGSAESYTVTFKTPLSVNAVFIQRFSGGQLLIEQVKMYKPLIDTTPAIGTGGNTGSVVSFSPDTLNDTAMYNTGSNFNYGEGKLSGTLTASRALSKLTGRVLLYNDSSQSADKQVALTSAFNVLEVKTTDLEGKSVTVNAAAASIHTSGKSVPWNSALTLSADRPVTITLGGKISMTPAYGNYRLVLEIVDTSKTPEQVLARQTFSFKIQ